MSTANFIPKLVDADLDLAFVAGQIVTSTLNNKYEGTLQKGGDTIKIVGSSNPQIQDYKAQGRKFTDDELNPDAVELKVDQEKGYSFRVDDVDAAQAAGSLEPYTEEHGQALAEDAEKYVIAKLLAEGTSINVVGSAPVTIDSPAKAKAAVKSLRTALTKAKVPVTERYVAVNPAFGDLLLDGLSDVAASGGDNELRNGQLTRLYGLTILETPCFAEETKPVAVAYHAKAASFVSQLAKTEAVRAHDAMADVVRGLNVYGSKVTRPAAVITFVSGGTAAPVAP